MHCTNKKNYVNVIYFLLHFIAIFRLERPHNFVISISGEEFGISDDMFVTYFNVLLLHSWGSPAAYQASRSRLELPAFRIQLPLKRVGQ
jgi:hypothetical protein